jgi:hypothetical protein
MILTHIFRSLGDEATPEQIEYENPAVIVTQHLQFSSIRSEIPSGRSEANIRANFVCNRGDTPKLSLSRIFGNNYFNFLVEELFQEFPRAVDNPLPQSH